MRTHTRNRRSLSRLAMAAAVAGAAVLGLSACSSGSTGSDASESASLGTVNVQLSWIKNEEFVGEYFADDKGYYADAGFDTVNLTAGPSTGASELLSGQADIALSDAASIGTAVAEQDAPLKIVGATFQKNPFTILSLKDGANIATPQDLIGKKIGVQDSNVNVFKALLKANDISEDQVTIVPVQFDPSPLTEGQVDGFFAYLTNEAITVAQQGHEVTNLAFADNGLPFVAETVSVTEQTLQERPEMVKAFLKAEIQGWNDAYADRDAGFDLIQNKYGKDSGQTEAKTKAGYDAQMKLVSTPETEQNGLFTISDDLKAQTIASLKAAGIDLTEDQLFDTSLLDEVYSENPSLKDYTK
ncbi:ABC transporter substrate-binding protein [Pseudoclavibacter caeni]|nr:ABC transporter substrate-binding protein [Pseudoclavibacter caeni]NYJ96202.1 ABC-type nitrate/sulfonate/bicarbonate transport system substrate-binding protein [Pseudoclavibacter caeni]